jgi:hypothetical protein
VVIFVTCWLSAARPVQKLSRAFCGATFNAEFEGTIETMRSIHALLRPYHSPQDHGTCGHAISISISIIISTSIIISMAWLRRMRQTASASPMLDPCWHFAPAHTIIHCAAWGRDCCRTHSNCPWRVDEAPARRRSAGSSVKQPLVCTCSPTPPVGPTISHLAEEAMSVIAQLANCHTLGLLSQSHTLGNYLVFLCHCILPPAPPSPHPPAQHRCGGTGR